MDGQAESIPVDLESFLRGRLPETTYEYYANIRGQYFWEWKTHRNFVESSVRGLRSFLYEAGAVSISPTPRFVRSRPFHEYAASLGFDLDRTDHVDSFSGLSDPTAEREREFVEPGDCLEMHENARLGWVMHGSGRGLYFSVETTLVNCLKEEYRWDRRGRLHIHQCPTFYGALKTLEIWSVGDFAVQMHTPHGDPEGRLAPFRSLCAALAPDGGLAWDSMLDARRQTQDLLDANQSCFAEHGNALVLATMLGFLIDELLARVFVPNGMDHWYRFTSVVLQALRQALPGLRLRMEDAELDPDRLEAILGLRISDCETHCAPTASQQQVNETWLQQTEFAAEQLRKFGFAGRKRRQLDNQEADLVFSASNALWRWIFFLEQRQGFGDLEPSLDPQRMQQAAERVYRWLQRPWGVVTPAGVDRAFRGLVPGEDKGPMPRALSALTPLLQTSIAEHFAKTFGVHDGVFAGDLVKRLISCRQSLYLLRHLTRHLQRGSVRGGDVAAEARAVIHAMSQWVYQGRNDASRKIGEDVNELIAMLKSGQWMRDLTTTADQPAGLLTHEQQGLVRAYLDDPVRFTSELFRFDEPEFHIEEWIGVFPPESFSFRGTKGQTAGARRDF